MTSLYRLPESLPSELQELRQMAGQFSEGLLPAARFQAFRVPQGIYEQRESGTFMLRARLVAGILMPDQMRVAADVATTWGDGILHLTSRQDLQIHGVRVTGIYDAVKALTDAGLSTKGGGGNTVRNIAGCDQAGVCAQELFDVTPHVASLTEALIADPLSSRLPRKYKIAFSGCSRDCAGASVNDLGFIGRMRDGEAGFAVYVGGGMGAHSRVAALLEDWVSPADVYRIAEAVKRVFDKHGNRKNRHRARLRFLIEDLGFAAFEALYRQELSGVPEGPMYEPHPATQSRPIPRPPVNRDREPGFDTWRNTSVLEQRQPGYFTVEIAPEMGMIGAACFRQLAGVVERHGEGLLRATNRQTAVLRWVSRPELAALHAELAGIGIGGTQSASLRRLVSCAGASTCRLGICRSRGLAGAIREALASSGLRLDGATGGLTMHISGCPNACGRHPVAQIGFFGAARRVDGRVLPYYVIQFGGHVEEGRTVLASGAYAVPARSIPAFLIEFLRAFEHATQYPDFEAFLAAGGRAVAQKLCARFSDVSGFACDDSFSRDWGSVEVFSLAGRGAAECGSGAFDLIELDLAGANSAFAAGQYLAATISAARALLVTRAVQSGNDVASLELFLEHFVEPGLIDAELKHVVERARAALDREEPEGAFDGTAADVHRLLSAVRELYTSLGPSLRV